MRLILTVLALLACGSAASASKMAPKEVTGAGSTFDYPFCAKAFRTYSQVQPDVAVSHEQISSGGGIEQFSGKNVDFGVSDVPMDADELATAKDVVLQVPVALGGEGIAHNLPGIAKGLHLTRELAADIYLGKIAKWNDPAIAKLNPSVNLPNTPITVVHRPDGSCTTYIFTTF